MMPMNISRKRTSDTRRQEVIPVGGKTPPDQKGPLNWGYASDSRGLKVT